MDLEVSRPGRADRHSDRLSAELYPPTPHIDVGNPCKPDRHIIGLPVRRVKRGSADVIPLSADPRRRAGMVFPKRLEQP